MLPPISTLKWSLLVGKPMGLLGKPTILGKPPVEKRVTNHFEQVSGGPQCVGGSEWPKLGNLKVNEMKSDGTRRYLPGEFVVNPKHLNSIWNFSSSSVIIFGSAAATPKIIEQKNFNLRISEASRFHQSFVEPNYVQVSWKQATWWPPTIGD